MTEACKVSDGLDAVLARAFAQYLISTYIPDRRLQFVLGLITDGFDCQGMFAKQLVPEGFCKTPCYQTVDKLGDLSQRIISYWTSPKDARERLLPLLLYRGIGDLLISSTQNRELAVLFPDFYQVQLLIESFPELNSFRYFLYALKIYNEFILHL